MKKDKSPFTHVILKGILSMSPSRIAGLGIVNIIINITINAFIVTTIKTTDTFMENVVSL